MVLFASAALSGCETPAKSITANSALTEQAYESAELLSSKEQKKDEENRRAEIEEQYSIYEPYGMTYNREKDRFFYNDQIVRSEKQKEIKAELEEAGITEDNGSFEGGDPNDRDNRGNIEKLVEATTQELDINSH